ncbi:MAG: hypothetical protein JKY56_10385 [Kofleriaceae bacterium]|nr:hypothetical protein [Kofleriaceae bacterium]
MLRSSPLVRSSLIPVLLSSLTLAACLSEKVEEKGLVDTSSPPESPLGIGKADGLTNLLDLSVESTHPYVNDLNEEFVIDLSEIVPSCTGEIRLHFAALQLEDGYDYLQVVNSDGQIVESYTGNHNDQFSPWIQLGGNKIVSLVLETDYSVVRHGFRVDGVEWASNLLCPAFVPNLCGADEINIARPRVECGCQQQSLCIPKSEFHARRSLAGGFTGGFSGKRLEGAQAWTFSNLSRTDFRLGTIEDEALTEFMRATVQSGMLYGEDFSLPGNISDEFSLSAGGFSVGYARVPGTYPEDQATILAHFESLFVCGEGQPMTCDPSKECLNGSCIDRQSCVCAEIYSPVCGTNGQTYGNACEANCVDAELSHDGACGTAGDICGGKQGLQCQDGFRCRFGSSLYDFPFPDASGSCVADNYCDAPQDCGLLLHIAIPGAWACEQNQCSWEAGSPWTAVPDWSMETTHPYSNNASEWKQLYAPDGATDVRVEISEEFYLENDYDFLEVWTWNGAAWAQVARFTGTEEIGASYEFSGRFHYLHFVSDNSVTVHGFSIQASYLR